ncbi:TyeA family type III secretion system gatekeeper subunit [Pseudomonas sp. HN11]|uniref:TyeA family type III secretion system gatekeeper subunit n=1 Tax=Pseudomonas sp. HN11 TaxID=1344094 RepID=UPI001F39E7D2|nr:TyeA family type III secretion system gatekeeper subunit [Pseudomonas sp. HN11]UII72246.1 TyeA family type III secretion system gatekeeper subunit [Pseudomonas sp. HN11]
MKVESHNDVPTVQRLDQPVISNTAEPAPAKGVDEKLAQLFNQEVELNKLPLAQRQMGLHVPAAEQLVQLYEQLGHPAQASMASVSRRIRMQLLRNASVDKLLDLTGGDPARAFVVLKHMASQADAELRKSEAALARAAIAKFEARFKREIQAGLNIAVALQAAGADPQERQALRALYYASVVTRQSLATMMQALLGVYGGERFYEGLNVMRKALADDIAARVSSMPTPLLRSLLLGLRSCGQLGTVLADCMAFNLRLGIDQDAVSLLQRLLGYADSGIDAEEILRLGNEMGSGSPSRQLAALNALYPLIRQLPLALWADNRAREETLFSFVVVMDELNRIDGGTQRFPELAGAMT